MQRRFMSLAVAAVMAGTLVSVAPITAAPAQAATTCGNTYVYKINAEIKILFFPAVVVARHESQGRVCENDVNITQVDPILNRIVPVGVGQIYNNSTSSWHTAVNQPSVYQYFDGAFGIMYNGNGFYRRTEFQYVYGMANGAVTVRVYRYLW